MATKGEEDGVVATQELMGYISNEMILHETTQQNEHKNEELRVSNISNEAKYDELPQKEEEYQQSSVNVNKNIASTASGCNTDNEIVIDAESEDNDKNDSKYCCNTCTAAVVAIFFISIQFVETISYVYNKNVYWYCKLVNITVTFIILCRSILVQRNNLKLPALNNNKINTIQSQKSNIILLFMAEVYFATLASLIFFKVGSLLQSLSNFSYIIGCNLVATHFIIGLKWGKISKNNNYNKLSTNWWSCIYLIISFFNFMVITVIYPWFEYNNFVELNNEIEHITGEFVHVLIMYGCRPALTVMAFRIIEQIMHILFHHDNDDDDDVNHSHDIDKNDVDHFKLITFPIITTTEIVMLTPFILIVIVLDLMTISTPNTNIYFLFWAFIFLLQSVWTIYIIKIFINNHSKQQSNMICIRQVILKHMSLFIASIGWIIAIIGTLGVNHNNWTAWIDYIISIIYAILQMIVLILFNEIKINSNVFNEISWSLKSYGKIIVILHIILIIHGFLGEGHHLEETLDEEEEHNIDDGFNAVAFIFYFWSIEFHLASIERIKFNHK